MEREGTEYKTVRPPERRGGRGFLGGGPPPEPAGGQGGRGVIVGG